MTDHFSSDLIWECTKHFNSYQVKRRSGGGSFFTRDPFNLVNEQSRKHSGFVHDEAIGLQPGTNGGVKLLTKKGNQSNKPASSIQSSTYGSGSSSRKTYRGVIGRTTKKGYRTDLRGDAVARASAIKLSQKPKKESPQSKLRGARAKKAAA